MFKPLKMHTNQGWMKVLPTSWSEHVFNVSFHNIFNSQCSLCVCEPLFWICFKYNLTVTLLTENSQGIFTTYFEYPYYLTILL